MIYKGISDDFYKKSSEIAYDSRVLETFLRSLKGATKVATLGGHLNGGFREMLQGRPP